MVIRFSPPASPAKPSVKPERIIAEVKKLADAPKPKGPSVVRVDEPERTTPSAQKKAQGRPAKNRKSYTVTVRMSEEDLDWWKENYPQYTTKMNEVLADFVKAGK